MALIMKIFWKIINQKRFKQIIWVALQSCPFSFFILNFLKIYLNYNKQKLHSFRNAALLTCYFSENASQKVLFTTLSRINFISVKFLDMF